MSSVLAEVVIDSIPLAEPKPYTYRIPPELDGKVVPGSVVLVPFGNRMGIGGVVTALTESLPKTPVRDIQEVLSGELLPPTMTSLLRWVAEHYLAPFSAVWMSAIPRGVLARWEQVALPGDRHLLVDLAKSEGAPAILARQLLEGPLNLAKLSAPEKRALQGLRAQGAAELGILRKTPKDSHLVATLIPDAAPPLTPRQREVLEVLKAEGGKLPCADWKRLAKSTSSVIKSLEAKGAIAIDQEQRTHQAFRINPKDNPPELTPDQAKALAIISGSRGPHLLFGVTGSGKTEVYLRAIADTLAQGKQAIFLVPEISLTPQMVARISARFGDRIALLHSNLSEGERREQWQRLRQGDALVAVGARSAIFAPVPQLGLIVIDEEHEGSYKQDTSPRYHARDVAIKRAELEGATLILGSATPAMESYQAALEGRYSMVSLPKRVYGQALPEVAIVDMREELNHGNRSMFSRSLQEAMGGVLERKEQAILLLNRRGFSRSVLCRNCGYVVKCPNCAISLVYHKHGEALRCHYCDHLAPVPERCPSCRSPHIRHFGAGTQQVEDALKALYPEASIARMDADTTSRKGSHAQILDAFGRGEIDCLIGTQMVAKGLDFPKVTLVGVIAADLSLNLPDFRASERTFQLLTQVAGRAGRGELTSQVVIQTYAPEHTSLQFAQKHDYQGFFDIEVENRRELAYPPFGFLINLVVSSPEEADAIKVSDALADRLMEGGLMVLGPAPAPLALLRGRHRVQMLLKDATPDRLSELLKGFSLPAQTRLSVDVDPVSLL